jgi:hypothetical protein
MTCEHTHVWELRAAPVTIRYCRHDECQSWEISWGSSVLGTGDRDPQLTGTGLEDYQDKIAQLALDFPAWESAEFLYTLGGHVQEIER